MEQQLPGAKAQLRALSIPTNGFRSPSEQYRRLEDLFEDVTLACRGSTDRIAIAVQRLETLVAELNALPETPSSPMPSLSPPPIAAAMSLPQFPPPSPRGPLRPVSAHGSQRRLSMPMPGTVYVNVLDGTSSPEPHPLSQPPSPLVAPIRPLKPAKQQASSGPAASLPHAQRRRSVPMSAVVGPAPSSPEESGSGGGSSPESQPPPSPVDASPQSSPTAAAVPTAQTLLQRRATALRRPTTPKHLNPVTPRRRAPLPDERDDFTPQPIIAAHEERLTARDRGTISEFAQSLAQQQQPPPPK